jgi:hypothetical protein
MRKIYQGIIREGDYGENYAAILLDGLDSPLAELVADDMDEHGHYLTVRYFISDEPRTEAQLIEGLLQRLAGAADAKYEDVYSEYTGYLWTDQELEVGGHDLLAELEGNQGKFLWLEITYSQAPVVAG